MLKVKKIFSAFVGMAITVNALMTMPFSAFADEETGHTYTYDGYEVSYDVTNAWGNTEVVSVTLSNTGDSTIENWMLYFDPNGQVHNTVNVQEAQTSAGTTYFRNSGYNANINPDSSVSFCYMVDDCEGTPDNFTLCQTRTEKESGYQVSLKVNQTWGDSFNGEIIIQNNTDKPIESWELTVDTNFTITEITNSWAAAVTELEPYSYMLKGTYTGTVYPNSSVSLGFNGVRSGEPTITDYSLTEVVADDFAIYIASTVNDDIDWSELPDSDKDGLPDKYEDEYGCDPMNPDSDGDGLPDGYEILTTGSDPANAHSIDSIFSDGEYDNDSDGLNNYQEYLLGTDPLLVDSDCDGLSDGDEVNVYGTDPLNPDTDGDGLSDGDEIALGLNPLVSDSDGDGIPDNEEKFSQSKIFDAGETDTVVQNIDIAFEGTGYINSTTNVESIMDTDWMCSNIVGLIGEPYDISSSSKIENAEITFNIDKSSLGDTKLDDLKILWYNEEDQRFIEMETIPNTENSTLTAKTEHFSKYLIVDCKQWYNAWKENLYTITGNSLHTAITIDCSSSMISNDPNCYRITAANSFVDVMNAADLASVIFFADGADEKQDLTGDQDALKTAINQVFSAGTTNYEAALRYSINSLEKQPSSNADDIIIFLSDGRPTNVIDGIGIEISEDEFDYSLVDEAANKGIRIYTIGLTKNVNESILKEMARRTNGEYYYANTAQELIAHFLTINMSEKYDITTDTDGDGIPDLFETYGMPVANGQVLFSDPNVADTDGDGLKDGEEVIMHIVNNDEEVTSASGYLEKFMYDYIPTSYISSNGGIYFEMVADPNKEDTDGDGILDVDEIKLIGKDGIANRYNIQNTKFYNYKLDEHFYDYSIGKSKLNPMHKDTIQSLYTELMDENGNNNPNNATYLKVNGNSITIETKVLFTGYSDMLAKDYYQVSSSSEKRTLSQMAIDGIEDRWNSRYEEGGKYLGSILDFYPGMEIELSTHVTKITKSESNSMKHISIDFKDEHSGAVTRVSNWTTNSNPSIEVALKGDTRDYGGMSALGAVVAHEFGHAIGLKDAYNAPNNKYYEIVSNEEVSYNTNQYGHPSAGEIMYYNGRVLANDIEMVLYAYSENTYQVFVPYYAGETLDISKAIRSRTIYKKSGVLYEWNGASMVTPDPIL